MATRDSTLTAEEVRAALHYDPLTGIFTWRWRDNVPRHVNVRDAGKRAGTIKRGRRQYRVICLHSRLYRANRLAWFYMKGVWPENQIDHRNLDSLDDRWENLRPATVAQNAWNAGAHRDSTHGFKGVQRKQSGWTSSIMRNGIRHYLGIYKTPEEAHAAYTAKAFELDGDFFQAA